MVLAVILKKFVCSCYGELFKSTMVCGFVNDETSRGKENITENHAQKINKLIKKRRALVVFSAVMLICALICIILSNYFYDKYIESEDESYLDFRSYSLSIGFLTFLPGSTLGFFGTIDLIILYNKRKKLMPIIKQNPQSDNN